MPSDEFMVSSRREVSKATALVAFAFFVSKALLALSWGLGRAGPGVRSGPAHDAGSKAYDTWAGFCTYGPGRPAISVGRPGDLTGRPPAVPRVVPY